MNYLAHAFLSQQSPEAILGALLGDFVKGEVGSEYPTTVRDAILLHRRIDRYTDAHPLHRACCAMISPPRRLFAPVLVDMFYDHFLARHWADYHPLPLTQFAQQVYAVLLAHQAELPPRLQWVAPRMAADDWLSAYAQVPGIEAALDGIARRLGRYRRAAALHGAIDELTLHYVDFERHFRDYFPQLIAHTQTLTPKQAA